MPATIYDIARQAGVSISTVSKALNDSYSISEETKRRIRAVAEDLEYTPNARARSFARRRSGTVLFVTDLHRNVAFENPHMFEIMTGISQYLDEKGCALLMKHASRKDAPGAIRDLAAPERPEVILCTNNYLATGCLHCLRQAGVQVPRDVAVMTFDNYPFSMITDPQLTTVEADMYDMGQEAARFILRKIKKPELRTQSYCTVPRLIERSST